MGLDSLGRAAAQTRRQATTGCLGMPVYFVQSHGMTIWERCVSKLAGLDDQRLCGLQGLFQAAACGQYQRSAGGSVFRGRSSFVLEHAVAARLLH